MDIRLRLETEQDLEFSFRVYASTRAAEMALSGWDEAAIGQFLRMQFDLQYKHYHAYYPGANFQMILCDAEPVGRLYVERTAAEIRIIDIALLPMWQRRGIGSSLLGDLIRESEAKKLPLTLHVEFNNPIREYYARLGFVQGELRGVYYFMERRPGTLAGTK